MAQASKKIIDGFSLDSILQISSMEKKSMTMSVRAIDSLGYLYLDQGELIDARTGELTGHDAAMEILGWQDVQIELGPLEHRERRIDISIMNILLHVSKLKDDRQTEYQNSDKEILEQAIEQAEAHQYKEAHNNLLRYLKKHKKNTGAWVWYARVHGSLETMEKALQAAQRISPHDPFVIEEITRFKAVKEELIGKPIRKCLFCWTPIEKQATYCPHCSGFLTINKESLDRPQLPHPAPFTTAVKRYKNVSKKLPNLTIARYCLCLANLNLGNLKEALHHLDKASKQSPDNQSFARQFSLLMDFIASGQMDTNIPAQKTSSSPVAKESSEDTSTPNEEMSTASTRKSILVVEDSATIRKVITIALKRNGYDIIEAEDGLEALSRVSEKRPDLILLDVILPKMDGFTILSILKGNKRLKQIPVIMLTSKDGFINKIKGKMAGAEAYLTKPFNPQKMIKEINKHL